MSNINIFSALAKYNAATDENYLTEAFVFLINSLLTRDCGVACEVLNHLCAQNGDFCFSTDETISISTQDVTEQGTPDIKISSPDKLIYIEVKHDSPLGYHQLEKYKKALQPSKASVKHVVLLTRFAIDFEEDEERPDKHCHWFDVYNWLVGARDKTQDAISNYLIEQFMGFLEVKQMTIQKVEWEYIKGVPALFNLLKMIEAAFQKESLRPSARGRASEYTGLQSGDGQFWCGFSHEEPLVLLFELQYRVNIDFETLKASSTLPPRINLNNNICFYQSLETIHFFSLDKDKQLEEITKFVKSAHTEAQKMKAKG